MTYYIGICDDERLQVKINSLYIKDIAERNNISISTIGFTSAEQLLDYLKLNTLHIVFLDIDMGGPSGISAAIKLFKSYPDTVIIFITGYKEYGSNAYELEALGYILKPVDINKLERLLKKALIQIDAVTKTPDLTSDSSLVITEGAAKIKLKLSDILYIERNRYQSIITSKNGVYHVYESITALEDKTEHKLLRINQSELINPSVINTIKGNTVYLNNGEKRTISRSYKKAVLESFLKV